MNMNSAQSSLRSAADRYFSPSLADLSQRLIHSIKGQNSTLRSIIERLELVEEENFAVAVTDGATAQAERNLHLLIERFHRVARQMRMRYNSRPTLEINDEYDVQNLLHALLVIFFDDVREEQWTPDYAGGASKMDFLLPTLQTAIEVKKARATLTPRKLGEELIIDIARYQNHPQCQQLFCFVYDPDGIISNPRGIETDLSKQHNKLTVRAMIMPR